jgi:glycine/D-amino acid oxidase-like deaminating enzyme
MANEITELSRHEESSFWARQYGPYTPSEPLSGDTSVDVAVVGGGITGLTTAREFHRDNPGAIVAVFEGTVVGWGASGRNGGFSMKLFGLEPEVTKLRWGVERTVAAHRYAQRAVAFVKTLIESEQLDSDYRHTGMFRVSYSERQLRRLERTYALFRKLGIDDDMSFWRSDQLRAEFATERYVGGIYETETGILNPCKHVRELKRLAVAAGVQIYERTPVTSVARSGADILVHTPSGQVRAKKLVFATNAYSRSIAGLPKLRSRQVPVWTFQVVTEPLSPDEWASVGWKNGQSLEDNRQLVHYFRPTVDGRITMGGGNVLTPFGGGFDRDFSPAIWRHCEHHLKWIFPQLAKVRIAYRWGGPVSVNSDLTPEIGFIGDRRVIYSVGCVGHGVSLCHLNGRLIADLLAEKRTDLTDLWIVDRKSMAWPPEPVGAMVKVLIHRGLQAWDCFEESTLDRGLGSSPLTR